MDVIRRVLDKQLLDRAGRKMGRVDGIVMELREGKPPRLAHLEVGVETIAARVHPRIGKWVAALAVRYGPGQAEPSRIEFQKITNAGATVQIDLDAAETQALAWENWLREKIAEYESRLREATSSRLKELRKIIDLFFRSK